MSASSMQLPAHLVTNSPPSRNVLPSQAMRENSSNTSLPVAAPRPEETKKRNESPHPQEESRSQRTVIRPHAEQVNRTASVQPFVKPSTSYPPSSSSSERRANTPHAEQVDRTASIQPSAKPSIPSPPPFSSSEGNATRLHTGSVNRTASSSVQPSINPSIPYHPPSSFSERNATRPSAQPVNRTASVRPPAKPSTPPPPLDRPSASMSLSSPPQAPPLAKMASNRMRGVLSYEYQAQSRESLSESPHPPVADRGLGNARSREQGRKDPSGASRRPPAPAEHTPATTKPRQDHKDPSDAPQTPVPPEHIPTTTDHSSRQDRKDPSATLDKPPVPPEHTPATAVSPSLQDPKGASAVPSRPLVPPKHTPATIVPPSNSLSQPVSEPSGLNRSKSGIQGKEGRGAGRAMQGSSSVREEPNRVLAPEERENRLKDSANAKTNSSTGHAPYRGRGSSTPYLPDMNVSQQNVGLSSGHSTEQSAATRSFANNSHPQSSTTNLSLSNAPRTYPGKFQGEISPVHLGQKEPPSRSSTSEEYDEPVPVRPVTVGDGPRMRVAGDETQKERRDQTKQSHEGGKFMGVMSSSLPNSDAGKSLFGNVVDVRPLPAQLLSTSISRT